MAPGRFKFQFARTPFGLGSRFKCNLPETWNAAPASRVAWNLKRPKPASLNLTMDC